MLSSLPLFIFYFTLKALNGCLTFACWVHPSVSVQTGEDADQLPRPVWGRLCSDGIHIVLVGNSMFIRSSLFFKYNMGLNSHLKNNCDNWRTWWRRDKRRILSTEKLGKRTRGKYCQLEYLRKGQDENIVSWKPWEKDKRKILSAGKLGERTRGKYFQLENLGKGQEENTVNWKTWKKDKNKIVTTGKLDGKRSRGRQSGKYLNDLVIWHNRLT